MRPSFYTALAQQEVAIPFDQVAPVRGMDGTVPIHNMPEGVALFLYNILPSDYGCQTRLGYRTWAQNLSGSLVTKSLIPFIGQVGDFSTSRLFAATKNGIYDVTSIGADNPAAVVTFGDQTDPAGWISHLHFTDPNGQQVILLADSRNGMYEYDPTGSTWTKYTTEITFPDATTPADIEFLAIHKGRLWLIARDSADAYYLPVGTKAGVATKFQFGSKMAHGGYLVGLWNWSIDGGNGLDDYLLAQSKGGDILVYQGTDPAQADKWNLVGRWFIGPPPAQRRGAQEVGGDTVLLSSFGLTSAAALLNGIDPTRVERNVTGKITRLVRSAIKTKADQDYWQVTTLPEEGLLLINSPKGANERHIQFVLNLNRVSEDEGGGWGLWRDVPGTVFATYNNEVYFGTTDGRVCVMRGSLDEVDIDGLGGLPVNFSALLRYSHFQHPGMYKQVQWMRPQFISGSAISIASKAFYDYRLGEENLLPVPTGNGAAKWDAAEWDKALWSGTLSAYRLSGGSGYGREAAIYIQGQASSRATMASVEGTYTPWKFL